MARMIYYTPEQVHKIVDLVLLQLDSAGDSDSEPEHLENDIPQNASPSHEKAALTVKEAADLIGVSKPTMYELVNSNRIHHVNVGKKILISRRSLLDWLEEGETYGKEAC